MGFVWFVLGAFFGASIGFFTAALLAVADDD
jgi:hypothetical protein